MPERRQGQAGARKRRHSSAHEPRDRRAAQPAERETDRVATQRTKSRDHPTAENQSVMQKDKARWDLRAAQPRPDPQLVWRGKDEQDWSDLVVQAPPLYIQEKVHPKVLIDDLLRRRRREARRQRTTQLDLFADFNGLPEGDARPSSTSTTRNWSNRMILGDSLQVMASLAEREGLRGQGAVHLYRPALRHQVQLQLSVVDDQPRREGRQARTTSPASRSR